jgi:lipopolysaccharide export system protein LptA
MRFKRYRLISWATILFFALSAAGSAVAEAPKKEVEKTEPKPIVIKSKTLEVDNETKVVTFRGEVNAQKDEFTIDCQEMRLYYENTPNQSDSDTSEGSVDKIVAEGQVKITRTEGGMATSDKAIYYQKTEKVVLTGNPVVKQENDFVEGDRITMFLKENRTVVEGSGNRKVRALIFPKREKR